jgi:hypothetical protein
LPGFPYITSYSRILRHFTTLIVRPVPSHIFFNLCFLIPRRMNAASELSMANVQVGELRTSRLPKDFVILSSSVSLLQEPFPSPLGGAA